MTKILRINGIIYNTMQIFIIFFSLIISNNFLNQKINYFQLECCGVNSADDWKEINDSLYLPPSCCKKPIDDTSTCIKDQAFNVGCKKAFYNIFIDNVVPVTATVIGIGELQVCTENNLLCPTIHFIYLLANYTFYLFSFMTNLDTIFFYIFLITVSWCDILLLFVLHLSKKTETSLKLQIHKKNNRLRLSTFQIILCKY